MIKLYLDDIRDPHHCLEYMKNRVNDHEISLYSEKDWDIVRDYNEFVSYIEREGVPDLISFDHDLHLSHYTPREHWDDYDKSKAWQDSQVYQEKTGLDCAKYLVEYCDNNHIHLPRIIVHSQNPVGTDNIHSYINSYRRTHGTE